MNTLNFNKDFSQSNHSTTEADLFEIHINIDFPPFGINMNTSRLGPVLEIIKISELEQTVTFNPDISEVFSQMNPDFRQSLPLSLRSHS